MDESIKKSVYETGYKIGYKMGLEKSLEKDKWISVEERLPNDLQEVMFFYYMTGNHLFSQEKDIIKRDIVCGHYEKGVWHICYLFNSIPLRDDTQLKVSHWMPLPEYPL